MSTDHNISATFNLNFKVFYLPTDALYISLRKH